jgi:hypothetical protein
MWDDARETHTCGPEAIAAAGSPASRTDAAGPRPIGVHPGHPFPHSRFGHADGRSHRAASLGAGDAVTGALQLS